MKQSAVYILCNKRNGTLYTGVTSNLVRRTYEHKNNITKGFAEKYCCNLLVFYELYDQIELAIAREKQLKASSRKKKILLIENMNPEWQDLYSSIL